MSKLKSVEAEIRLAEIHLKLLMEKQAVLLLAENGGVKK